MILTSHNSSNHFLFNSDFNLSYLLSYPLLSYHVLIFNLLYFIPTIFSKLFGQPHLISTLIFIQYSNSSLTISFPSFLPPFLPSFFPILPAFHLIDHKLHLYYLKTVTRVAPHVRLTLSFLRFLIDLNRATRHSSEFFFLLKTSESCQIVR